MPAVIVAGNDRPPKLNTELLDLAAETVTLPPLAVRVPEAVPLLPSTTLPRANVAGVTPSCPVGGGVVVPVPVSVWTVVEGWPLLVKVRVPDTVPAA